MTTTKQINEVVALDIEDVMASKRGEKILNILMFAKGMLYRTKRGRLAVQIHPGKFERLKPQLQCTYVEGLDGTILLTPATAESK